LFSCAKDLLVEANDERVRQHRPARPGERPGSAAKKLIDRLSKESEVELGKSVTSTAQPNWAS